MTSPANVSQLTETDRDALTLAIADVERTGQAAADAQLERDHLILQLRKRYELVNGDTVDPLSGRITRVKPAADSPRGVTTNGQVGARKRV